MATVVVPFRGSDPKRRLDPVSEPGRALLAEAMLADVLDAARGMGYRPLAMLLRIELPLATPAILAGLRIATVTTIGLVTVTALIGQGGLGSLINTGLIEDFKTPLVVGTVLCVLLALGADLGLAGVERAITPWSRQRRT